MLESKEEKKKPKRLKACYVSKLDAFSANMMVSSFKEGQAEKNTFCGSLSGVGIRRGGQQGPEVRGPGCGRDACPLPEVGAWGERWRGMARELKQPRSPCSHPGLSGSLLEDHKEPWDGQEEAVVPQLRVVSQVAQWVWTGGGREVALGRPGGVARLRPGLAVRVQGRTELREAE